MLDHYQRFYLSDPASLETEIKRLGLNLPVADDVTSLANPVTIHGKDIANRLWLQPMQGYDANPSGDPGPLTLRRYTRYAAGGYGLLWMEGTAVTPDARAHPAQLCLHQDNLDHFTSFVETLRDASIRPLVLLLQLTSSKDCCSDDYLQAAELAQQAGFDGVDIRCLYGDPLFNTLKTASTQLGDSLSAIRKALPNLILASRLTVYDAVPFPNGFGVDDHDFRQPDPSQPIQRLQDLQAAGLSILNLSACSPNLPNKSGPPLKETDPPVEHPLAVLERNLQLAQTIGEAVPGLFTVAGGFSWLRHLLPQLAAAAVTNQTLTAIGLGRSAMAYPDAASDILTQGRMDPPRCCMVCYACSELQENRSPTGCVIRDPEIYGKEFRQLPHDDAIHNLQDVQRCHNCEQAPCVAASPSGIDIPACLRHFAAGRYEKAYDIIRLHNPFPEMTAYLCPRRAEAACIETILSGTPVPIRDTQLTLAHWAGENLDQGVTIPTAGTGKKVAVVGGGPAGLAATVRLLQQGHHVLLIERDGQLGGIPEQVIPSSRYPGAQHEIDAVLKPGIEQGRLNIQTGCTVGQDVQLKDLQAQHDAVLLAVGLWGEEAFGDGGPDITTALDFLQRVKNGLCTSVPKRVAILSGDDCAMDAARTVQTLGASDIYIVYEGPRSEMHWHMKESWFDSDGVHCLIHTRPLGVVRDAKGHLTGLRVTRMMQGPADPDGKQPLLAVPDGESVLAMDLVIASMKLMVEPAMQQQLDSADLHLPDTGHDKVFVCGALCNGGASVEQCIAEGLQTAEEINLFFPTTLKPYT